MSGTTSFNIHKIKIEPGDPHKVVGEPSAVRYQVNPCTDTIASEEPLEVWLKLQLPGHTRPTKLITTMRSPGDDLNLVRGWLHTSGLVEDKADIQSLTHTGTGRLQHGQSNQVLVTMGPNITLDTRGQQRVEYAHSGCGVCGQQSIETLLTKLPESTAGGGLPLPLAWVYPLAQTLKSQQPVFAQTGGNHGAGLFELTALLADNLTLTDVREDVGRHNALDKLIGAHLPDLLETAGHQYGVVLSGRISFDLVQKAAMANITFVLAMGAPSSLAIELARECDICLVGFIKAGSMNIYSCPERILCEPPDTGQSSPSSNT